MTRAGKLLEQLERNPQGWRYEQVASLLGSFGFQLLSKTGSHRFWRHPKGARVTLVEKGHGTVKPYQIRQAVAAIRDVQEET